MKSFSFRDHLIRSLMVKRNRLEKAIWGFCPRIEKLRINFKTLPAPRRNNFNLQFSAVIQSVERENIFFNKFQFCALVNTRINLNTKSRVFDFYEFSSCLWRNFMLFFSFSTQKPVEGIDFKNSFQGITEGFSFVSLCLLFVGEFFLITFSFTFYGKSRHLGSTVKHELKQRQLNKKK